MLWLHHDVFRIYCGSRIFSIAFIVVLSRCTVLAFYENCNNPRLVKKLLFIGGDEAFRILLGWGIYDLV